MLRAKWIRDRAIGNDPENPQDRHYPSLTSQMIVSFFKPIGDEWRNREADRRSEEIERMGARERQLERY